MNYSTDLKVTSMSDLVKFSKGTILELPAFGEEQPFVAKIKRPSMLAMAKNGKIPNGLLSTAGDLFVGKGANLDDSKKTNGLSDLFQVLDAICEECFVEPTYKEIKEAGIDLSDDQMMFIFNYTQQGVKSLESFRK